MILLPIEAIKIHQEKIDQIDTTIAKIYRLITFSRQHLADDLLDSFLSDTNDLKELLSIKNAQMEAQNEEEAQMYLKYLKHTLDYVVHEIKSNRNFKNELQLFQLFRLISPESHASHPNRYRDRFVQIGSHICPDPKILPGLVTLLFYNLRAIRNPIIRAIYLHHELIRIHPFSDGNGRVTRIAKNWILMYHLYPPIFIKDDAEKKEYISTLSKSFHQLNKHPGLWNTYTAQFFDQELHRLSYNTEMLLDHMNQTAHSSKKAFDHEKK